MRSGRTLWDEICVTYQAGVEWVGRARSTWDCLAPFVDRERFAEVRALLAMQENEAAWWRDACLSYFQTHARRPFPAGVPAPSRTLAEYRAVLQAWLDANQARLALPFEPPATLDHRIAQMQHSKRVLHEAGWMQYGWPERVGGRGGPPMLRTELGAALAARGLADPGLFSLVEVLAPTLIDYAKPALAAEVVPKLLSGEEIWCQGFSEPDAGSDLASLRCRARRDGDGWRITGQKVWSSGAHVSDVGEVLARTEDDESLRHRGLTMFLVGMWHYTQGTSWNFVIYANLHAAAMVFNRWNRIRVRKGSMLSELARWAPGLVVLGGVIAALGHLVIGVDWATAAGLGVFAVVMFLVVAWLPETGTPWNNALHILLTFHFTVLSRVFFRAESWGVAKRMCTGLLAFDMHGLRPGLVTPWVGLALAFGCAYHFTPRAWVDVYGLMAIRRTPGWVLGLVFAAMCLGVMLLLGAGPRAFIYFNF